MELCEKDYDWCVKVYKQYKGSKNTYFWIVHFAQCKSTFENETRTISFVFEKSILHSKYTHGWSWWWWFIWLLKKEKIMDEFDHKSFFTNFLLDKIVKKDVPKNFIPIQKSSPPLMGFLEKYLNYKISSTHLNTQRGKNWRCEIYLTFFQKTMDGLMTNNHKNFFTKISCS